MKTKLFLALASATATAALAVTPAMAAPTTTTTTTPKRHESGRAHDWETVAGLFRTEKAAHTRIERLRAKGSTGFVIEHERDRGHAEFEVEKPAPTRATAERDARRVRHAGFHASVERS